MRFLLILLIVVLIAGCGGGKSSILDDTTPLHNQLVEELNRQLSITWEPDLAPVVRFEEETRILFWALRGDYDLSGEVNISDLTPIAQYFHQSVDPEVNPALIEGAPWWVDGDDNSQINISDITPIAQNYQHRAFWWKTSVGWGQPLGGSAGQFYALVPEGVDSKTIVLKISSEPPPVETPENKSPIAILQATPNTGNVPLQVEFDASPSVDLDGNIARYEWDFEGDGIYDFMSEFDPIVTHVYSTAGSIHARLKVTDNTGGIGIDDQLVIVSMLGNISPVATVTASPISGTVPAIITLDATGSYDLDGNIVRCEWDLEGDGVYDATSVGPDSIQPRQWPYNTAGIFTPRIRVTDDAGAQGTATGNVITITMPGSFNQPPVARLNASSYSGDAPFTVLFDASESVDPDGSIVRYDYDFNDDGIWDAYDSGNSVEWTYESPGYYQVTVRVTDNDGAKSLAGISSIQVNAVGNELPIAHLTTTPNTGYAPLLVTFDASASSDPDGNIVRYDYDFNSDGIWDAYDSGSQVQWEYNTAGIFITKVRVTDNSGAQSTAVGWVRVNIAGNQTPIADLIANPTLGNTPLAVLFDASASNDPDGNIVQYDYDFDGDGIWDAYDANSIVNWTYYTAGIFVATVRVTDNNGAQDTASVEININTVGNVVPIAELVSNENAGYAPLTIQFWADASHDPDGTIVRYDYDFNSDGIWDAYDSGNTVSWTYYTAGIFVATVRVTDNNGAQDTATVEISVNIVGNEPPVANLTADPASGNTPLSVHFDATNSVDPDGNIVQYDYDFDGDGIWDAYDANSIVNWTYYVAGTFTAKVRVTDNDGAQDFETCTILVDEPGEPAGQGDWYMFGREPTHNRRSPFVGPQTATLAWKSGIGGYVRSSPVIGKDGTIYVGSGNDYHLYALTPDGLVKWRADTRYVVYSSPAIGTDGTIYAVDDGANLYAIRHDGGVRWQYHMSGSNFYSSPAIGVDGTIYTGGSTYFYAINPNGTLRWRYYHGEGMPSSPAIGPGETICLALYNGRILSLSNSGAFNWKYETGSGIESSPAIGADGTIYVGGTTSYVYAINPDGTLKWTYATGGGLYSSPAIGADGTIYIGGSYDHYLYAINSNGTLKWRYLTGGDMLYSSPTIGADGTIYIGNSEDYRVYAVNSNGTLKWRYQTGDSIWSSPALGADGTLYVGSHDWNLYAFHD